MMSGERGLVLPLALAAMAVGALFVAPFLGYASTTLMSSQQYGVETGEQYSADAGVEHALWRLLYESDFAENMTAEDPSVEYSLATECSVVNGANVTVNVTKIAGLGANALAIEPDGGSYNLSAGHRLEFWVVARGDDHCNVAYDTETYDSLLQVPTDSETLTYHLHNNPTPPTEDTNMTANLPMDDIEPTADTLFNYDKDYPDLVPGRKIEGTEIQWTDEGWSGELELKQYQNWRTEPYDLGIKINGSVYVNLNVIPNYVHGDYPNGYFNYDDYGAFTVYLFDYDPDSSEYTEIGSTNYFIKGHDSTEVWDNYIDGGEWADDWYSTVPEGKYVIVSITGDTGISAEAILSFDSLNLVSYEYLPSN
ncbi:MAG: hypothetical protein ACOC6S_03255 [Chloroflexota bacterium]